MAQRQVKIGDRVFTVPENATMEQIQEYVAGQGIQAPSTKMEGVQGGTSTSPRALPTDVPATFKTPQDEAMNYQNLDPNGHIQVLKGLVGLPQDMSLGNIQQPGIKDIAKNVLMNSPVNPLANAMQTYGAVKGIGSNIINAPSNLGSGDPYRIGQGISGVLSAVPIAEAGIGGLKSLVGTIPSKVGAGAKFDQVMAKAKDIPLELSQADEVALRAQELGGRGTAIGRGASLPKVMRDYLRTRETSPQMTYEVGRDFASNAGRLSAAEAMNANPTMQRQVALLAKALSESNREAAVKSGVGELYDQAMREYARAAGMEAKKKIAAEILKKAAVTGIAGAAGYGAYKALAD